MVQKLSLRLHLVLIYFILVAPAAAVVHPQAPPPSEDVGVPSSGVSLNPEDIKHVQKLCKFASSSLDYDDVDTAIKNLTEALHLLHRTKQN